jgi:chromosome segregation ATPase
LESYSHLSDIDTIWSNVESHKDDLSKVHSDHELFVTQVGETIGRINDDINSLQAYRSQLESYFHLGDIDTIWSDVANHKEHLSILDKLLEDLMDDTNQKTEDLKKEISEMAIAQKEINEQLSKKIKIAYRIAGCAMAFSIGQFVLQWFGVL